MNTNKTKQSGYRQLDLNKLKGKSRKTIASEEALKDVIPIEWSESVLQGKIKVLLVSEKKANG